MIIDLKNIGMVLFRGTIYDSEKIIFLMNAFDRELVKNGVLPNDYVGIYMNRCPEMIIAILSCLYNGYAYIPIDPELPRERVCYMMGECRAVITNSYTMDKCIDIQYDFFINIDSIDLSNNGYRNQVYDWQPDDIAYLIYTSGTTGVPKGVEITRANLENLVQGICEIIPFSSQNKIICLTTISFDIFFVESILPLIKGAEVILADEIEQKNPRLMARIIEESEADIMQVTPSRMQLLYNYDNTFQCLKHVKKLMIGGERLPEALLQSLQKKIQANIYNMYGPTETTIWSCVSDLTYSDSVNIGMPIRNTKIFILNEKNEIISSNEYGQIGIAGDGVGAGYHNDLKLTEEKFILLPSIPTERVYLTGDWGRYLPDGKLECLGRIDNQVKINGFRVELEEIENVMMEYDSIYKAIVCKSEEGIEGLVGFYLSKETIEEGALKLFLQQKVPDYMIPFRFIHLADFPTTNSAKADRKKIIDDYYKNNYQENIVENKEKPKYYEIVSDIITAQVPELVKKSDSFNGDLTNLGINSIIFIKLILALEEQFDIEFEDEVLVPQAFPTVDSIVRYIKNRIKVE